METDAQTVEGIRGTRAWSGFSGMLFDLDGVLTPPSGRSAGSARPFPDAVRLLDALALGGKRLGVVSARSDADDVLARSGLLDRFPVRLTGAHPAWWKPGGRPTPEGYARAAQLLDLAPQDTVLFQADAAGVEAGLAGGVGLVVGVRRDGSPDGLARSTPDLVLWDLTDFLRLTPAELTRGGAEQPPVRFEGVVVCPPSGLDGAGLDGLDGSALGTAVQRLRGLGAHVAVAGATPRATAEAMVERLAARGVGAGLVLVVGWLPRLELSAAAARATVVSVAPPPAPPRGAGMTWIGGGEPACVSLLDEQIAWREAGLVPSIDDDPAWVVTVSGDDATQRRAQQALLTVADTRFGTRGVREEEGLGALPRVLAAGIFDETTDPPSLLEGPGWTGLHLPHRLDRSQDRRALDLRTGVLYRVQPALPVALRSMRFAALARPGSCALRAEGAVEWLHSGAALIPPATDGTFTRRQHGPRSTAEANADVGGQIAAASVQSERAAGGHRVVERLVRYTATAERGEGEPDVAGALAELERLGFDGLLAEQRAAWARRWDDALVCIDGDPELELAVRFNLFHLMAAVPTDGEAAVGARGLAGPSYRGHVFWDTDVFMLPFFAATCPPAARAILEYRIRRLGPARRAAAELGRDGARFPWESALTGLDVTPTDDYRLDGTIVPIYTGRHEEHIVGDVAWAAVQYARWTGDAEFLRGPGRPLVLDTARYWASRLQWDDAGAHIGNVIGPDEYHELVDDNAYTNVLARWNLRRAAELAESGGDVDPGEIRRWREAADRLVDHYDPESGRYEQFTGYYLLEPLLMADVAEPPVAADLLLGRERVSTSQVIKQPDVLMLHHLVPEETAPGSLHPNLAFYLPRCSHGSSLSPAIHAALLARAGRPEEALPLFRMACRLDLDNLTETTAGGLHMATFGGVWQALAFGFAGIRPDHRFLTVDPRVPPEWAALRMRLRHRGRRLELTASADEVEIRSDGPVAVTLPGAGPCQVAAAGRRWTRTSEGWRSR